MHSANVLPKYVIRGSTFDMETFLVNSKIWVESIMTKNKQKRKLKASYSSHFNCIKMPFQIEQKTLASTHSGLINDHSRWIFRDNYLVYTGAYLFFVVLVSGEVSTVGLQTLKSILEGIYFPCPRNNRIFQSDSFGTFLTHIFSDGSFANQNDNIFNNYSHQKINDQSHD